MRNKEILNEINRVRDIMGLSQKSIILEAVPPGRSKVARLLDSAGEILFGTVPARIRRTLTNAGDATITFPSGRTLDVDAPRMTNLRNAITNKTPFNLLDDVTRQDLLNVLDEGGYLDGNMMYDDLIDDYIGRGGQENLWLRDIQRRVNSTNPRTGKQMTLDEVLLDELEDPFLVSKIKAKVQKRMDELETGKLELDSSGRLVSRDSSDVVNFNRDVPPLSPEEIKTLSNPGLIGTVKNWMKSGEEIVTELKSLYKNLIQPGLSIEEKKQITDLILQKTRQLANWKRKSYRQITAFIDSLAESTNPADRLLAEKLKKIEETNGGWDVFRRTAEDVPAWRAEWQAFKEAFMSTMSFERMVGRAIYNAEGVQKLVKFWKKLWGSPYEHIDEIVDDGTITNTFFKGSPRGWPSQKVSDEVFGDAKKTVDYYKGLRELGGMPLVTRSYLYEYAMRLVKYKIYFAVLATIYAKYKFEWGLTEQEQNCSRELTKKMLENRIYSVEAVLGPLQKKAPWLPQCLWEIPKQSLGAVLGVADYMAQVGEDDGQYFWDEVKEKMLQIDFIRGLSDLIPGLWDNFAYDGITEFNNWVNVSDMRGPTVKPPQTPEESKIKFYSGDTGFMAFVYYKGYEKESWDESTGIGKTKDGKRWMWRGDGTNAAGQAVGNWEEVGGSPTPDTTIDTVEELFTKYPFLRGNNSTVTLNSDKTFNEKNPDGVNFTISIINGKGYYTHYNGTPIDHLELKAR